MRKIKKYLKNTIMYAWYIKFVQTTNRVNIRLVSLFPDKNFRCGKDTKKCLAVKKSGCYQHYILGESANPCCYTHLYEVLRDIAGLFESEGVEYFISYGTLLGAVRHKGIIPWDADIDIGILREDEGRAIQLLKTNFQDKYMIREYPKDNMFRLFYSHINRLHIDVEIWDREDDDLLYKSDFYVGERRIPVNTVFPLKKYQFYDLQVNGPCSLEFLKLVYGNDYMTLKNRKSDYSKLNNILPSELKLKAARDALLGKAVNIRSDERAPGPIDPAFLGK